MFQLKCSSPALLSGKNGICYPYKRRPMIPILIRGDLNDQWNTKAVDFLLDTGADVTVLHSNEALRLGLDIDRYDSESYIGTPIGEGKIYYKKGILIRIGNFPDIAVNIGFSPDVRPGLRLLGRETLLDFFGIAFHAKKIGIFTQREI